MWWTAPSSTPSHYLNQLWFLAKIALKNKRQWHLNQNKTILHKYKFQHVFKIAAIPTCHQHVKTQIWRNVDYTTRSNFYWHCNQNTVRAFVPYSKVHWASMEPTSGRQDPGGYHVGPKNLAIWSSSSDSEIFRDSPVCPFKHIRKASPFVQYIQVYFISVIISS